MAAITGQMEMGPDLDDSESFEGFGAAEKMRRQASPLAVTNTKLMRTALTHTAVDFLMKDIKFRHTFENGQLYIEVVDSPHQNARGEPVIPTTRAYPFRSPIDVRGTNAWSFANSKMDCPSWDLPAGGTAIGGTCPGANPAQPIVPENVRSRRTPEPPAQGLPDGAMVATGDVRLAETICSGCYATGGNFAYANKVAQDTLRWWWVQSMLGQFDQGLSESEKAYRLDDTAHLLVESLLANQQWPYGAKDNQGQYIKPVRVHSSGDFYNPGYAMLWLRIADLAWEADSALRFWAPTRTWAAAGWQEFWARNLPQAPPNLVVRPSAMHFDDPSPGELSPRRGMGTTSMYATDLDKDGRTDFNAQGDERRFFDWECNAYAVGAGDRSCSNALNPDGGKHCRACWTKPGLRVNYVAH